VQDTILKSFDLQWQPDRKEATERAEKMQQTAVRYYNRAAKPFPEIHIGSQVDYKIPEPSFGTYTVW